MKRKIIAQFEVDDDTAFKKINDGPIRYFEMKTEPLKESQIFLKEAFIADEDENDEEYAYLNYLAARIFSCLGNESCANDIADFRKWKQQNISV